MVEYGIRFVINIFDLCIYWRALEAFVGKRKTSVEFAIALLVVSEAAGSLINQMGINWLNLITMAVILGLFICQYEEKVSAKVIIVLMYMGLVAVAEPAGYVIYTFFEKNQVKNEAILYYSTVFAMELFRAALIEVFCRFKMGKSLRISAMPKEVVYMLVLIPVASFIGCFLLIEVAQELLSTQTATLCMSIIFTIIIMNYLVFLMIERYTDMAEKRHEEEMILSETAYWKEYYADMERYQEQIQDIKHDMKNRLATLYDAAGHGDSSVMMATLKQMLDDISLTEEIIHSANPVLNSILKIKAAKARENGIKVDIKAFIPKKIAIETGDMGVLYGNLLDNAIEACCQSGQEEKILNFETKYQGGNLLILVRNSKAQKENKGLVTTKSDKRKHGRGIRTVRRVAEKYGGTILLEDQGSIFEAKLLLTGIAQLE